LADGVAKWHVYLTAAGRGALAERRFQQTERTCTSSREKSEQTIPMTAQGAADFTGWSVSTINRKIRDHELSVVNLEGGKYRFSQAELDQLKATKTAQKRRLNKADS
jgi:excisionase family DNA binding protein